MYCGDNSAVNHGPDGHQGITLRCRSWKHPPCAEKNKRKLIAQAKAGNPTYFVTLTVDPARFSSPEEAAAAIAPTWASYRRMHRKTRRGCKLPFKAVFEAHKSGWPHLHILCRAKWISIPKLRAHMLKHLGGKVIDVQKVENSNRVAWYVAKYVGKAAHQFGTSKRHWQSQDWIETTWQKPAVRGRWPERWIYEPRKLSLYREEWAKSGHSITEREDYVMAWSQGPPDHKLEARKAEIKRNSMVLQC